MLNAERAAQLAPLLPKQTIDATSRLSIHFESKHCTEEAKTCIAIPNTRPSNSITNHVPDTASNDRPIPAAPRAGGVLCVSFRRARGVLCMSFRLHGIAEVAGLDGDELGYLLGKVAGARRIE
jgi:hypothetical protein